MSVDLLKKNALTDAEDLARIIGRDFQNSDVSEYMRKGVDLRLAAACIAEQYTGKSNFFNDMKGNVLSGKPLTDGMVRAIMNSMRDKLLGIDRYGKSKGATSTPAPAASSTITPPEARKYNCFTCGKEIVGRASLDEHKMQHRRGEIDKAGEPVVESSVIASQECKLNLDLSMLPDGRYAVPDFTANNDLKFFLVKRVKKRYLRTKLFVYGSRYRGKEYVDAGTIEVKEWSSDAKRLFGEQKPGDVYRGEFEESLELILKSPEAWAKLFGLQVGRCYRCGKTLTDEDSRAQGIGPECVKHRDQWSPFATTA